MKKIAVYTGFMTAFYREKIDKTAKAAGFTADYYENPTTAPRVPLPWKQTWKITRSSMDISTPPC